MKFLLVEITSTTRKLEQNDLDKPNKTALIQTFSRYFFKYEMVVFGFWYSILFTPSVPG